ncbi:hypothetical protein L208DRAFT_1300984, partial [Tricholoma matsutake]
VPDRYHESILYLSEFCTISYQLKVDYQIFYCQAQLQYILVSFEGPKETRGSPVCILKIFHIFMLFEGTEETRGVHVHILEVFHIFWFFGGVKLYLSQFSTVFHN